MGAQHGRAADVAGGDGGVVEGFYQLGGHARLVLDGPVAPFPALGLAEAGEVVGVDAEPVGEPEGDVASEGGAGGVPWVRTSGGPKPRTS